MDEWSERRRKIVALVGVLAALPAAILVVSGLLYIFSGNGSITQALDATLFEPDGFFFRVVLHPITVLGGLALALALNLIPLLRINIERGAETARATVALRLRRTHLAIAALGFGLCAIILGYAFTENFEVIPRTPARAEAVDIPAAAAVGVGWTAVRRAGGHWDMRPILTWDASTYAAFVESCRSGGGFILESQPSSEPNGVVVPGPICWQREPNR